MKGGIYALFEAIQCRSKNPVYHWKSGIPEGNGIIIIAKKSPLHTLGPGIVGQ